MYEQHFGLKTMPFRVVPSPSFLFSSDTHEESRARILYGIRENRGFVVVSGAVGLGKTTVLLSVLEELEETVKIALVVHPVESFRDLLRMVCLEFGVETSRDDEVTMLWELNLFLVERLAEGTSCVLMIDEAQNLPIPVLERVRTLSNLQTENASLLQIVLVGQPELLQNLDDPRLPQLRQRVGVWHEIAPLNGDETRAYVRHRLSLAGAARPNALADDAVCAEIYDASAGVPRLVNQVSDTALVIAYGDGAPSLKPEHVREARREMRLEPAPKPPSVVAAPAPTPEPVVPTPSPEPVPQDPSPVRADTDEPSSARGGRLLPSLAAVVILVILVIAAVRFGVIPEFWSSGATASDGASPESLVTEAEPDAPIDDVAMDAGPAASREVASRPVPEGWREAERTVERLRRDGRIVYSAHLASFRSQERVVRFADSLVVQNPDWDVPLYVERTSDQPPWHRVYGGGYADRGEAQSFARTIKSDGTVGFALVKRLSPSARDLLPSIFDEETPSRPGESG